MVADAIRLPAGSSLTGQPLHLVSVLASTADRHQQLEMTRAYWRLTQAVAEYHFCLDHSGRLERLKPPSHNVAQPPSAVEQWSTQPGAAVPQGAEPASLRLARASAAAGLRRAELEATSAQYELARLMRFAPGASLPLPADQPHVGPYRTNFHELFAGRTPPEPAALMERLLPIRREAVDAQAAAVVAAEDVLAAAGEQPAGDVTVIATCSQEVLGQQRAMMHTVCDYNRNIAEYGLTVAGPATNPQALAAMLIAPVQPGSEPAVARNVRSGGTGGPMASPTQQPSPGTPTLAPPRDAGKKNEPTPAPPRYGVRPTGGDEPTLAPPRDRLQPVGKDEPTLAPLRDSLQPMGRNEPTPAPPRQKPRKEPASVENKPLVPVEQPAGSPPAPQPRTANKPVMPDQQPGATSEIAASPLYPALAHATPAARAKQLTVALHWDRSLPQGIGKPMSLADCLLRDPGTDRRATIEAYWRVRQRAAEYQVLVEQATLLEGLMPVVLERRHEPSGAAAMLRLKGAQLATQASLGDAHAALVEAQYALAMRIGATGEETWPLASTIPHSGSYLLRLDAQPQSIIESWPIRRLATTIPALSASVQQHAAAVVEADAARVAAAEKYRLGGAPIAQAIDAVTAQTQETLAVLSVLTDYNRAIAEYVLTVMPPATPVGRLVAALVVKP